MRLTLGGQEFPSVFAALNDGSASFWDLTIDIVDPVPGGPAWEWTYPVRRLVFAADGSAEVHPMDGGPPVRAIARLLRRDYYLPQPESAAKAGTDPDRDPRPGLLPIAPAVQLMRKVGFVPFAVALLLYTPDERLRLELDLIDSALLKDPRAGRLPLTRRVRRTSRVAHDVDAYIARGEIAVRNARVLEVLSESHGLSPLEVTEIFGGVREFGTSALRTLAARGLATLDRSTGVYRPRFDAFRPRSPRPAPGSEGWQPLPNPALRTSVMELLAAADSRATCPLCGDPLPAGPRGILCTRCAAEVASSDEPILK